MLFNLARQLAPPMALTALFLVASPAQACNVPVFRYALERWPADPYEVIVLHRGPLASEDKAVLDALLELSDANPPRANLRLHVVDLNKQPTRALELLYPVWRTDAPPLLMGRCPAVSFALAVATLAEKELPLVIVRYPQISRLHTTFWAGRLDGAVARALLDSPARRTAVQRITGGESAVWYLLECGNPAKDEAAAQLLERELASLQATLKLPELTDDPEDKLTVKGPALRLAFSMVRVKRDDPAERFLIPMLLRLEPDLEDRDEPMAFAVYGRGRAMPALVGAGITARNVGEDARFLIGPCTCNVKEQNPGVDLLMLADWDALIQGRAVKDAPLPPLTGLTAALPSIVQESTLGNGVKTTPQSATEPGVSENQESCGFCGLMSGLVVALAGGLAVISLLVMVAMRRKGG